MNPTTGAFVLLDFRRLVRRRSFWLCLALLVAAGFYESLAGNSYPGLAVLLPPFAAFLAAWGLADDRLHGGLELILTGGVPWWVVAPLRSLLVVLVMLPAGLVVFAPLFFRGAVGVWEGLGWLLPLCLWAGFGSILGWRGSAGSVAALPVLLLVGEFLIFDLSGRVFHEPPPFGVPRVLGTVVGLFGPMPRSQDPFLRWLPPAWDLVRLLALGACFFVQGLLLARASLVIAREG